MSLYSAYKSAAKAESKEKGGAIGLKSFEWKSDLIDKDFKRKSETLSDTVGTITDALSVGDTLYGEFESTKANIESIEKATGEKAEGNILGQMFGIGKTKIGDKEIKNRALGIEGAKAKQQNMFKEWESNQVGDVSEIGDDIDSTNTTTKSYMGQDIVTKSSEKNKGFLSKIKSLFSTGSSSSTQSPSISQDKQEFVSYEDALKDRGGNQDLLNLFHKGGDTSQTAWEALQKS